MKTNELSDSQVTIEPAIPSDAGDIRIIQTQTWYATYPNEARGVTLEGLRHRLEGDTGEKKQKRIDFWTRQIETANEDHVVYVARLNNRPVGFIAPGLLDGQWQIGALYVLPEAQSIGIGSRLIEKAIHWLRDKRVIYVHVAEYNQDAIRFYERHGFNLTGKRLPDDAPIDANIPELEMVRAT